LNNRATINFSRTNLHFIVSSMQFTANIQWLSSKSLYNNGRFYMQATEQVSSSCNASDF
jgi:hypothetical protein